MTLSADALDQLFLEARTHSAWLPKPVDDALLERITALTVMGPTSANSSPGRFLFVKSPDAKQKLKPALSAGNVEKTMAAPVTVVVGMDLAFHEYLPKLYPQADARSWFAGNDELIHSTAFRNASLQGAYLIMAARALGLDAGPMSGFDATKWTRPFSRERPSDRTFSSTLATAIAQNCTRAIRACRSTKSLASFKGAGRRAHGKLP